jgi:hypothetical protein
LAKVIIIDDPKGVGKITWELPQHAATFFEKAAESARKGGHEKTNEVEERGTLADLQEKLTYFATCLLIIVPLSLKRDLASELIAQHLTALRTAIMEFRRRGK